MKKIKQLSIANQGRPIVPVNISNYGEIFPGKDNDILGVDEGKFIFH